jgi:hypothetical protein
MSKIGALKSMINSELCYAKKTYMTLANHKQLKLRVLMVLIVSMSLQSQAQSITIKSSIPFPFSTSQEKRATSVDKDIAAELGLIVGAAFGVEELVEEYEDSLSSVSSLEGDMTRTGEVLNLCQEYISAKISIVTQLPGFSKLTKKMFWIVSFKTRKIYELKKELVNIKKSDNYMTEGERKILLLDIIDRALKITI